MMKPVQISDDRVKTSEKETEKQEESEFAVVQAVVDHRKTIDRFEYLVKWRKQPASENIWVTSRDFDSLVPVNHYW